MLKEILLPHEDHVGQQCRKKAPMLFKGMLLELLHNVHLNCFTVCTSFQICLCVNGTLYSWSAKIFIHFVELCSIYILKYPLVWSSLWRSKRNPYRQNHHVWTAGGQMKAWSTELKGNFSPHCEASAAPGGERTSRNVTSIMTMVFGLLQWLRPNLSRGNIF